MAAPRIAAGQRKGLARAVAEGESPASAVAAGEAPADERAEGQGVATGRVFERPGEKPGARGVDLRVEDRAGVWQGCWAGPAADGSAGIRRARSWAPRVPGDPSFRGWRTAASAHVMITTVRPPTPDQYPSSISHAPPCKLQRGVMWPGRGSSRHPLSTRVGDVVGDAPSRVARSQQNLPNWQTCRAVR